MEPGDAARYSVQLNKRARKGLNDLVGNRRRQAERLLEEFFAVSPLAKVPGKVKKLSGAYARMNYLQYSLPDGYRIWYWVDEPRKRVFIVYIGPHPK